MRHLKTVVLIAGCALLFALPIHAQSRAAKCDPSLSLADMGHMQSKGRLQDAGAAQTRHIVALGKTAIPLLIACLREETKTKESVVDFWFDNDGRGHCIFLSMRFVYGFNVGAFDSQWSG